ncbi:MAG TPA: hypothetical protein VGW75_05390 [Solirubrobacteraceae bacterium]|nr:hypothetical protein [Solirubrobacteraceae bacterium]
MLRVLALAAVASLALAGPAHAAPRPAPLTEPAEALERALECGQGVEGAARTPVILLHGTGSTPEESFADGYAEALPKLGFPVCTVRFPERATVDLQRAMQYAVFAVRAVAARSGRRVSVIGHSQGALHAVYAPHFWPDLPALVDDVVGLAGPYRGTQRANENCMDGRCPVTSWQFRFGSALNGAFAAAPRPAGPSFTAVASAYDELVTPAPDAARLEGAANVVIQDLCPGRPVDHFAMVGDAAAYALALDALTHGGPADPARFDPATCQQTTIPGGDAAGTASGAPGALGGAALALTTGEEVDREPPLVCPFDAAACRAGGAGAGAGAGAAGGGGAAGVRLTRSCLRGGRLRMRVRGDVSGVRRVTFAFGRLVVARDGRAPFVRVAGRAALRRTRQTVLWAHVYPRRGGSRVTLRRTLPRCGL